MRRRLASMWVLVMVLALVAAACSSADGDSGESTTTTATQQETTTTAGGSETTTTAAATDTTAAAGVSCDEPVKIGVITDQSGPLAIYGAHVVRAFPLGMEYATGTAGTDSFQLDDCTIEVLYRDDASDAEAASTAARELIEVDDVDVLVGSVSSGVTAGIQELALQNDVIHIAAPAAANDLTGATFNPNSFRTSRNNYQDAVNICEYLTGEYSTFVQIAPDYSFGYGGATAFRDACTFFGGEFPSDDIFAPADTQDFTPYMEQVLDSPAEAFIVTWAGGGFVPLAQAAADLGVTDEKVMAAGFVDNIVMPVFFSNSIGQTSGILYHYTLPDNPINDWLIQREAQDGAIPDLFDADAMNAAIMIVEALKATGGDASADALRDAMEGMSFEGPKGLIEIRAEDHVAIQDMYIVTLDNVDDPEFKYFTLVETNRPEVPCLLEGKYLDRCGDLPVGSLSG